MPGKTYSQPPRNGIFLGEGVRGLQWQVDHGWSIVVYFFDMASIVVSSRAKYERKVQTTSDIKSKALEQIL